MVDQDLFAVRGRASRRATHLGIGALLLALLTLQAWIGIGAVAGAGGDWPQYLNDAGRSGFTGESLLNASNAASLKEKSGWPIHLSNAALCPSAKDYCSNTIAAQPAVATVAGNRLVYVGSWNGDEYALCASSCSIGANTYTSGQIVWSTYVGRSSDCGGPLSSKILGVTDAAAVGTAVINTVSTPAVFVGGGGDVDLNGSVIPNANSQLFALDAQSGHVLWHTALGSAPTHYLWSSPLLANGSLYIGIASADDCPLVQGGVVQIDPNTGNVQNTFNTVANGCTGASIWGSPTVDPAGSVYVATGNPGNCTSEPYAEAVIKLTSSLSPIASWQIPLKYQIGDGDFGDTPTLFTGTVSATGALRSLLGIANKNGNYYVFDTANVAAGPVKQIKVAKGCMDPTVGCGSISPSSWDGQRIYVAGGKTTIGSTAYIGSLRAFNPNNLGKPLWQRGFKGGPVLAAVTSDPGVVLAGAGVFLNVVNSTSGSPLFSTGASGYFYGAAAIAYGVVYEGDTTGALHAFSVNGQ